MISPVTPPQSPLQELIHGPLPTARTVRPANGDVVYGICSLGDGGRVLDKFGFATLDCRPGTRPGLTRLPPGVLARPAQDGHTAVAAGG
ncbi:hypothetical protein OIE68_39700 [Nocardia vinacea]|uniref:Uncharacterized protein n=1 Tax=Nocardia vinacea TaxID=96468 RepID=A0ABZ1YI68_9NOCA|nr:hypothetical protein OIE68_39700 [Nocardia vinacea]